MTKGFKATTNIMNKSVIELVARQDEIKQKLGLNLGAFAQSDKTLPRYDETNLRYKEYEKAEKIANDCLIQNTEIPKDIEVYLLDTIEERKRWHEYCRTHYRESKHFVVEDELNDIFM